MRSDTFDPRVFSTLLAISLCTLWPNALSAQSLTLSNAQTTVSIPGLAAGNGSPAGEPLHSTFDSAGNFYVADWVHNSVWKLSPSGVQSTVGTGLNQPSGVALDANGNIIIADSLNGRVVEVSKDGTQTTLVDGLNYPYSVAADSAGNIFVADTNQQSVLKLPAGGGSPIQVGSGWQCPLDVAVNVAGDVYVADACLAQVVKVPAQGQSVTVGSGFVNLWGLTLDAKGNLFVADSGNNRIVEVPANGGPQFTILSSGLNFPADVSLDAQGNLYVSDRLNNRVIELSAPVPNFGNVTMCAGSACSQTKTLTFNINSSVTVASIAVLTGGASAGDFTLASGSTCVGALTASATSTIPTCTVNVAFTPKYPGLRSGSVQILDAAGNVLGSTYVQGVGVGAEVTFSPAAPITIGAALQIPQAVALDAAGNAYIVDKSLGAVIAPVGGGALKPLGTGIGNASGVAVDGAGMVYILDKANGVVSQIDPVTGTQTIVVSSLNAPSAIAVDASGNLFIADTGNNRILEVVAASGAQITVGSGFSAPRGVAIDAAGDVFVADSAHNQVVEIPAAGGSPITINSALNNPGGLAVDGAGDLYIADTGNNRIVKVPAGSTTLQVVNTGSSSLSGPLSLALDPAGDLFIADTGNARVLELPSSVAPTLTYAATSPGTISADSPKAVIVSNTGNAALSFSSLTVGTNFAPVAGSGVPADCSSTPSLAAGASCNFSILFKPTVTGPVTSAAVLTDNAFGLTAATQSLTLKGQGLIVPTLTFTAPVTQTGGTQLTLSATSNSTSPVTFSSTTPTACTVSGNIVTLTQSGGTCSITASVAANATYTSKSVTQSFTVLAIPSFTFNAVQGAIALKSAALTVTTNSPGAVTFKSNSTSVCTVSGGTVSFLTSGLCQLSASAAATSVYAAVSATQNVTVGLASQTITFAALTGKVQGASFTAAASASSGLAVSFTSLTPTVCKVSATTVSTLTAGTCSIQAAQAGNTIYGAASPVTQSFTVAPAFTLTISPQGQTVLPGGLILVTVKIQSATTSSVSVTLTCSGGPAGACCPNATVAVVNGCATRLIAIPVPLGTPKGTYTETIKVTSGSISDSGTVTFTVK